MRDEVTRTSLKLELQAPQLRPEAFPWGSANNVEIHAVVTAQTHRRAISLPGVVDLSALLSPAEGEDCYSEPADSLGIDIMGCDNGVTFALGNGSIPLPPPMLQPMGLSEHQFRVCLTGEEGTRNGTLVGNFQARSPTSGGPSVAEAVPATESQSYPDCAVVDSKEKAAGEAADHVFGAENGMAVEQADHQRRLEHETIELLEAAIKILASPSSCVVRRARPSDGPPAARVAAPRERKNEPDPHDVLRERQVLGVPPIDISGHFDANALGFTLDSALSSRSEEEVLLPSRFPTAGFKFEPTTGSVDWHRIASVDVSKVERKGDLPTLRQFLPEVAVGTVDEEDFDANPGLVNAFRLAQLQTQYVLHCSQVLQRQCDGLETSVASMELETKGNSQGSTALKNRVQLLRKESRKQVKEDKIISGYAAMLRTHNPGLSSKVFLDVKGRLKVHKAPRHQEQGKRRATKRNRGGRAPHSLTLGGGAFSNNGGQSNADTEGNPLGSDGSPSDCHSRWSEAGSPAPRLGSPRPQPGGNTESTTISFPEEDRGSAFHFDIGEENRAARTEQDSGDGLGAEQDRTIHVAGGRGETMMPRGRRRGDGNAVGGGRARVRDDGVVQVLPRNGATDVRVSLSEHTRNEEDPWSIRGDDTRKNPSGTLDKHGSEHGTRYVTDFDVGEFAADGDEWAGRGPEDDAFNIRKLETRVVVKGGKVSNSDEQAPSAEQRGSLDRTPSVVTVSVKPKKNRQPTLSSLQDEDAAASPRRQGWRAGNINTVRENGDVSHRNGGIDGGGTSPMTPRFAAVHGGVPSAERTAGRDRGQHSSGGGGADTKENSLARGSASSGTKEKGTKMSAPAGPSPAVVAAASQLGLEGGGFPDVSEFDLDDISEIDAGGEWTAGSDGGGSLSS